MSKSRLILLFALLAVVVVAGCRSAHTTSAILYIDEQSYDKAVNVIHDGFQYGDDEPDAYYYLGEAYSHLALEAVEVDDYPEAKKNYQLAYDAYMRTLELDAAEWSKMVKESLEYNYANRVRQAALDWEGRHFEQAEGHLRLAFAALPDSLTPIKSIARMKMQMADEDTTGTQATPLREEALELLNQSLEANPEAYSLNLDKANVLDLLGRDEEAGQLYNELLSEHGDDVRLLMDIASLAVDDGEYGRGADLYVRVVDLNEADVIAENDEDNNLLLRTAGNWYRMNSVGRYEDAIVALDRSAELDPSLNQRTMLARLRAYYDYGMKLKGDGDLEEDAVLKADLKTRSMEKFRRAEEIGRAMTLNFPSDDQGFLFLSMVQIETGDFTASDANYKTYEELSSQPDF
ncbi:MAG: tetratricopeptide repeat protein [bacterium]|nr:tetratricopeptide repeat protein [bacterium]